MRSVHVDPAAWDDFTYWLAADRKVARRIVRLIAEVQRDPFSGVGKPEPLKGDLSGYWSRRIDDRIFGCKLRTSVRGELIPNVGGRSPALRVVGLGRRCTAW